MQLKQSISAQTLTRNLQGKWHGRYGLAACPVCQPERRRDQHALTLSDGTDRLLMHCFKRNCDFGDILAAAGVTRGIYTPPDPALAAQQEAERQAEAERKSRQAQACWAETRPITGTPAEAYLRSRGIMCDLPPVLRFHPDCWHAATAKRLPAMVAKIEGGERFAVHRTYLTEDGRKADVSPNKAMLGGCKGGAVRLREAFGPLVVGEGVETVLSVSSVLSDVGSARAALSTSGMMAVTLPKTPGELIVAVDGDQPGRTAGKSLARRASGLGWQVSIADPGDGLDFNDLLKREAVAW